MPYIARADYAKQKEMVGNGECVTLVKHLAGARASSLWREGDKVPDLLEKGGIAKGTVIATFVNGPFDAFRTATGVEWYFANIYVNLDDDDDETLLNWWVNM